MAARYAVDRSTRQGSIADVGLRLRGFGVRRLRGNTLSFAKLRRSTMLLIAAVGLWTSGAHAAGPSDPSAAAPSRARVSILTAGQVVQILDETVDWYRTLGTQQQNATEPSDLLILFANRQTADKVVALAFEIARANAELLSSEAGSGKSAVAASSPQSLAQQQSLLDTQRQAIQQEMNANRHKVGTPGKSKQDIEAKLTELQGELAMIDARKNLLDAMAEFVNSNDPKAAGANALKAQIDAIAASVPSSGINTAAAPSAAASTTTANLTAITSAANDANKAADSGIWEMSAIALRQKKKIDTIEVIDGHTAALTETFQKISAAPLNQLKAYSMRSEELAAQADNASGPTLKDLRGEFDTLAWLFKQTSEILIPLTKERILLQQYRHNLDNWRDSAHKQYREAVTALAVRLGIVAGILTIVFALAEAWRRAVIRYVHEPRRRYQLLLVRTIVLWIIILAVVGLSFVTEISTFATFAGLLTAGLAVAMQSVLVSVVGYFFLIGKYGIRVGDRIQIGSVVGEVIDLGLVRMHLMELNQQVPLGPSGRVVAFANLVVFQASGGLFKQIPGVSLSWHETTLTLPMVSDYAALKEKLLAALRAIVSDYSEELLRQTREIQKTSASGTVSDATPQVQMHLSNGHMEALIRYPVHLEHAAQIDERVAQAVLKVIAAIPE